MSAPTYLIQKNTKDSVQHSAGWCVAFVRFQNPATGYASSGEVLSTKEILIITDDVIGIDISNSKENPIKSCSIRIKSGDVYYPNVVSPGDWVFIWMHDQISKTNEIISKLRTLGKIKSTDNTLINWNSGLKFVGRVSGVGASDSVSQTGIRTLVQLVKCDAFSELYTKVYFTGYYENEQRGDGNGILKSDEIIKLQKVETVLGFKRFENLKKGLDQVMINTLGGKSYKTPDSVIALLIIWLLGIEKEELGKNILPALSGGESGSFSDAILVPNDAAKILKMSPYKSSAPLYNMYNVLIGLQKYNTDSAIDAYKKFSPIFSQKFGPFSYTGNSLKGYVYFTPPTWSDVTIWQIMNQYLHDLLNEMYTCLRCGDDNQIRPTIVAREKPFGTGLFNYLQSENLAELKKKKQKTKGNSKKVKSNDKAIKDETKVIKVEGEIAKDFKKYVTSSQERALFGELPRWKIDESMLLSMSFHTSENLRTNFVQVFGQNYTSDLQFGNEGALGRDANSLQAQRMAQIRNYNYITDLKDINRNGLKPRIFESSFDGILNEDTKTLPGYWARIKADHLFNGQLKPFGTIQLVGVTEPICEGDNLEIRGVVFHIDSVDHTVEIQNGIKTFRTSVTVSNGILASSLEDLAAVPTYPLVSDVSDIYSEQFIPGLTSFELGDKE